ncbi:MAG: hypothetical protein IMF18_00765 [Proteobacteria bacterium]|nr:hypothetical protein [Pseudomonadota bacterium]
MARKKPKLEYAIICDDIRQEVGKKFTFVGIYGGRDLIVRELPFIFPKLCFAVFYKDMKCGDSFSIELSEPSGKQLGQTINGELPGESKGYINFMVFALFSPLKVEKNGKYKLLITINNDKKNRNEIEFSIKLTDETQQS